VVEAARVELQDHFAVEHEFTGTVVALQHDDTGFELGGTLADVRVREGDHAAKGAVLAELDTQLLDAERRQLEATRDETAARARLVDANLSRETRLKRSGFAAEQRIDELRAEQAALAATLARIAANIEANGVRAAKSRLLAPFDAIVTRRYRDAGAPIVPGTPILRLMDAGAPEIRVGVPARLAAGLAPGSPAEVLIDGVGHAAHVLARGGDIDPVTRTQTVRLALADPTHAAAGELVGLRLVEEVPGNGAWLPAGALTEGLRGLWVVYALVPQDGGLYRVEQRDVSVLQADDERVFVSGALAAGELVVGAGLQRIVPGQQVRLAAAAGA
jgi:RND family efflux transporter MFP subunit